jgi:hypothetical protein
MILSRTINMLTQSVVMSLLVVSQPLGVTSPLMMTDTVPQSYSSMLLPPPPVPAGQGSGTEAYAAAPPS